MPGSAFAKHVRDPIEMPMGWSLDSTRRRTGAGGSGRSRVVVRARREGQVRHHGVEDGVKLRLGFELGQQAMAGGRIGQVDQLPGPDLDGVAPVHADGAGIVLVRPEVLTADRRVEYGGQKLLVPRVLGGQTRVVAEPQCVDRLQSEAAGLRVRDREVQGGTVPAGAGHRRFLGLISVEETTEGLPGVQGKRVQKSAEIDGGPLYG